MEQKTLIPPVLSLPEKVTTSTPTPFATPPLPERQTTGVLSPQEMLEELAYGPIEDRDTVIIPIPHVSDYISQKQAAQQEKAAQIARAEKLKYLSRRVLEYKSSVVICCPLAACYTTIIQHVEHYRSLPYALYVSETTYKELAKQYERVHMRKFEGLLVYASASKTTPDIIRIFEEKDAPQWLKYLSGGCLLRDQIISSIV